MKIEIRSLKNQEAEEIISEIRTVPDIVYIPPKAFKLIDKFVIVADEKNDLMGVCGIFKLNKNWTKLGPLVVIEKSRGQGIGKILLQKAIKNITTKNIYVGSSNPIVQNILLDMSFKKLSLITLLKKEIIFSLLKYFLYLDFEFVREFFRKKLSMKRGKYMHFVKLFL